MISDISQDLKREIWIATDHGGINIINKNLHAIRYIKNDLLDETSIIQNSPYALYCDDNGTVWVGSYKRGISYFNESVFKFKTNHLSELSHIKDFTTDVNAIVEDKHANLWIGTSSGLIYSNRETKERKLYQYTANKNSLSGNVIVSMLAAKDGRIWIGTFQSGLNVFDGNTFTHYRYNPDNPDSLPNDNSWALAEDNNGTIWIGTLGDGLCSLDPRTGKIKRYAMPDGDFSKEYIASICIGRDNNLYMATSYGVGIFSPATGKFERLAGNRKGTQEFSHYNIIDVYEDSRGLLWVATVEGLDVYNPQKDEITKLFSETTFGNEIMQAVIEDNDKNMWVTTMNSLLNIIII